MIHFALVLESAENTRGAAAFDVIEALVRPAQHLLPVDEAERHRVAARDLKNIRNEFFFLMGTL